jgi:HlyD family secretion protein
MRVSMPFPRARERSGRPLPRRFRWRWVLVSLVLLAIIGVVVWRLRSSTAPTTTTTTATVSRGALTLAVSGSGSVTAARTVDLPFQQAGTITSVDVKVGDAVRASQTLATLDTADLQLALQQAQANLKAAQASAMEVRSGSATEQDLVSAQAQLDSAKAQLQQTKAGTTTRADLAGAQAQLDSARAKLEALKNPSPAALSSAQTQLSQAQTSLQTTRDSLSQAKTSAYNQMQQAVSSLTQAQSKYATAKANWDYVQAEGRDPINPTTTNTEGEKVNNTLNDAEARQYYDAFVQAEAALNSAETAVQQAQLSYDAARQKEAAEVPLAEQQVANAQAQLDALKNPTATDLRQAEASVTQAQASLDKLRQGGTAAAIAQAEAQVVQAQANLEALTAPATAQALASADASVVQAQVAVATAQRNLERATLKAPFDGVVSAVSAQPGGLASTTTAAVTLVDRSTLHIAISLSETDAAQVQVGQSVALTFDALPTVALSGTVATIAPAATVSQNVVTYPITVEFDPGDAPVKVGMSASADIQVQQVSDALLVPSRAITTVNGAKFVSVVAGADRQLRRVPVKTGITSGGQAEIVSSGGDGVAALKPGDTLLVRAATTAATGGQGGLGGFRAPVVVNGPPPGAR